MANNKMESQEETPPIFKTWKRFYWAVMINLVVLILLFFLFTKAFE